VMLRTSHVYILMAALLNIAISTYLFAATTKSAQVIQAIGSILLIIAPLLLTYVFFVEPKSGVDVSGFTFLAIVGLAVGVILHVVSAYLIQVHTDK